MTILDQTTPLPTAENPGPFGHKLRNQFLFPEGFTQYNHGSFGIFPKSVQVAQRSRQDEVERSPDIFLRKKAHGYLKAARDQVAELIHADPEDLGLVENTTVGVNAVLRSFKFVPGDRILQLSTGYVSVNNCTAYVCETNEDVKLVEVPITFPMSDQAMVDAVEKAILDHKALNDGSRIRLAMIEWISSVPSIVHPVKQLIELLHSHGILVFIDGAHTIGQIPVDLKQLDADFFISNCHKWLFSIRGSAALFVNKAHQHLIHPSTIPEDYKTGFSSEFLSIGAQDYASLLSIADAIAFRKQFGEKAIIHYSHDLALRGGQIMAEILGTELMTPFDHQVANMFNVRLPFKNLNNPKLAGSSTYLMDLQMEKYNVFTPTFRHGDHYYTRVCAQIYLELSDYVRLSHIWKEIVNDMNAEEEQ
ncbi:hypothetical protein BGZ94_009372 [Podila epigama]|nr:hypothetical protein BGZ94_009372 [Podila epigama]